MKIRKIINFKNMITVVFLFNFINCYLNENKFNEKNYSHDYLTVFFLNKEKLLIHEMELSAGGSSIKVSNDLINTKNIIYLKLFHPGEGIFLFCIKFVDDSKCKDGYFEGGYRMKSYMKKNKLIIEYDI